MAEATEIIRSRTHPLVRRCRAVRDRRGRDGRDLIFLEGPRLLEEALRSGLGSLQVLAGQGAVRTQPVAGLLASVVAAGGATRLASDDVLDAISPAVHGQGIVAIAERPRFAADRLFAGTPVVLIAVAIQDPGNLGGLLRTAEAAGASGAILAAGCADPFSWKALRGSMGSALRLPHLVHEGLDETLSLAAERGLRLLATSPSASQPYTEADLTGPLGLLVGNEGAGLPAAALAAAAAQVTIPLERNVPSLNVGVAAGLLLFEAARQRRAMKSRPRDL